MARGSQLWQPLSLFVRRECATHMQRLLLHYLHRRMCVQSNHRTYKQGQGMDRVFQKDSFIMVYQRLLLRNRLLSKVLEDG
jgi:hypothetical protein